MALQKKIATIFGEERTVYLRVEDMRGDKNGLDFMLRGYLSREAAQSGAREVWVRDYGFVPVGEGRWDKQAYGWLRTLDDYQDAADILEEAKQVDKIPSDI